MLIASDNDGNDDGGRHILASRCTFAVAAAAAASTTAVAHAAASVIEMRVNHFDRK